mmetsp:Transcript_4408/g.12902  ORF Transcript_4408/g.12902 Transcript_4408/m.12902 type:complete len:279 (+) Transcript_4408:55-891(+)
MAMSAPPRDAPYAALLEDEEGAGPHPLPQGIAVGVPVQQGPGGLGAGPVLLGRVRQLSPERAERQKPGRVARGSLGTELAAEPPASAVLPVMLPGYAIARDAGGLGPVRDGGRHEWILAPGPDGQPAVARGEGAVRAGPHHRPHGAVGAAAGAAAGVLLGLVPLLVFPGLGYFTAKSISRARHTIGMVDETGRVKRVKLWKPGKHALLTEEGYWLVASDPRGSEMEFFIRRLIASMGGFVANDLGLQALVADHSGRFGVSSLARLQSQLRSVPWVRWV